MQKKNASAQLYAHLHTAHMKIQTRIRRQVFKHAYADSYTHAHTHFPNMHTHLTREQGKRTNEAGDEQLTENVANAKPLNDPRRMIKHANVPCTGMYVIVHAWAWLGKYCTLRHALARVWYRPNHRLGPQLL